MTPKPSQKIITFEAFKEQLEVAVTTLTKVAEEQPNARDAPIAFNWDSLMQRIKQQMPQDEYVVQPKPVNIPAGLGPYFYKLPRELCDQIFSHLLASGYPDFMRTSRVMKQEGKSWITKEGVYQISLGFWKNIYCQKPTQEIVATSQNVDIRINNSTLLTSSPDEHPELELLDLFAGSVPHRKTCTVLFEFYGSGYEMVRHEILSHLKRLRGFKKVVLRIWTKWTGGTAIRDDLSDDELDSFSFQVRTLHWGFEFARDFLAPHLGETEMISDNHGWSMVFYPRKAQQWGPGS